MSDKMKEPTFGGKPDKTRTSVNFVHHPTDLFYALVTDKLVHWFSLEYEFWSILITRRNLRIEAFVQVFSRFLEQLKYLTLLFALFQVAEY